MIDQLNKQFAINNTLNFAEGPGGLIQARVSNDFATAVISLHGAQVLSFIPQNQHDLLWVSQKSVYTEEKAIRGGIPICWPWFNAHPTDSGKPSHGFARLSAWTVVASETMQNGATKICLEIESNHQTKQLWPYDFKATLKVTVSEKLEVTLTTHNTGTETFTITSALHTYFNISSIENVTIRGLEDSLFLDSLTNKEDIETDPITIDREIDRVYLEHDGDSQIEDAGLKRAINISKQGSNSSVLWNPWIDKSERMSDFGNDEYQSMLCLETTNTHRDSIQINPMCHHTMSAIISLDI